MVTVSNELCSNSESCKEGQQNSEVIANTQAILNTSKTPMIHLPKNILNEFIHFSEDECKGELGSKNSDEEDSNTTTFRANPSTHKKDSPSTEPFTKALNSVKDSELNGRADVSEKVSTNQISHNPVDSNKSSKDNVSRTDVDTSKSVGGKKDSLVRSVEVNCTADEGVIEESLLESTFDDQVLLEESLLKTDDLHEDFDIDARSEAMLLKDPIVHGEVKVNGVDIENAKAETGNQTVEVCKNMKRINPVVDSNSSKDGADVGDNKISGEMPLKSNSDNIPSKVTERSVSTSYSSSSTGSQPAKNNSGQSSNSKNNSKGDNSKQNLPLNFTDAFKSLEVNYELGMQRPASVTPAKDSSSQLSCSSSDLTELHSNSSVNNECSDSSTVLGKSDNQGKKRGLEFGEVANSEKPDLKKVRVFMNRNISENSDQKNIASNVTNPFAANNLEMMKFLEDTKEIEARLKADKALELTSVAPTQENDDLEIIVDSEDLERKTVEESLLKGNDKKKLKKIRRKDLENLVIELFVDKVLYEHHLGQQKDLCKRLEATLEANRKKVAQFHKEMEDLKKVTQRLHEEHTIRRNQVIAPVKVKRSVGIQANPSIISKGLMHTSSAGNPVRLPNSSSSTSSLGSKLQRKAITQVRNDNQSTTTTNPLTIPVIAPLTSVISPIVPLSSKQVQHAPSGSPSVNRVTYIAKSNMSSSNNNNNSTFSSSKAPRNVYKAPSPKVNSSGTAKTATVAAPSNSSSNQMVMLNPIIPALSTAQASTRSNSSILQATLQRGLSNVPNSGTSAVKKTTSTSSNFIDLTGDEDVTRVASAGPSVLAIQRSLPSSQNASGGQFVALNNSQNSVGQLLLVPTSIGQPTATLVVGGISNNSNVSNLAAIRPVIPTTTPNQNIRINGIAPQGNLMKPATRVVLPSSIVSVSKHPAPLPKAPPQQTGGYTKKLPPAPILKLSRKDNSIVLSWNMTRSEDHEKIASYQLYAYQEGSSAPSSSLWKKVGSVKALELPMACTLTQFMPGHVYHFAVRAVDIRTRLGPFSQPRSIQLGKA